MRFSLYFLIVPLLVISLAAPGLAEMKYPPELAQVVAMHPAGKIIEGKTDDFGSRATIAIQAPTAQAIQYYTNALGQSGWSLSNKEVDGPATDLYFTKGNQLLTIGILPLKGGTTASLSLTVQQ